MLGVIPLAEAVPVASEVALVAERFNEKRLDFKTKPNLFSISMKLLNNFQYFIYWLAGLLGLFLITVAKTKHH